MQRKALFLSVRPAFASRILAGTKTIELRRIRPHIEPGDSVLIYSSSPEMAILGSAEVEEIICGSPADLWKQVKTEAGVSKEEYETYFDGAALAVGIRLRCVQRLNRSIPLQELRVRWPWLRPPQSYRYVRAKLDPQRVTLASLAPPP